MSETFMDRFGRPEAPEPPRRRGGGASRPRRRSPVITVVAVVMLLAGLGLIGWVGYQYFGTNVVSQRAFESERSELRTQWEQAPPPAQGGEQAKVIPGEAIALLRIPRFGDDYEIPILAGVDLSFLDRGVGHYPGTAQPGQVGNFAIAGHRVTHGQPFARLLELDRGDQVIVETRNQIFTYLIDDPPRDLTVSDTDTWVIDPVPGEPDAKPSRPLLTLTTCQDLFHSPDRSVGFAHLATTVTKP